MSFSYFSVRILTFPSKICSPQDWIPLVKSSQPGVNYKETHYKMHNNTAWTVKVLNKSQHVLTIVNNINNIRVQQPQMSTVTQQKWFICLNSNSIPLLHPNATPLGAQLIQNAIPQGPPIPIILSHRQVQTRPQWDWPHPLLTLVEMFQVRY